MLFHRFHQVLLQVLGAMTFLLSGQFAVPKIVGNSKAPIGLKEDELNEYLVDLKVDAGKHRTCRAIGCVMKKRRGTLSR